MAQLMAEPEYITVLEGPTPDFQPAGDEWLYTIHEGPNANLISRCQFRTNNGEDIRDRCKEAWAEHRPVRLRYPDEMRLPQEIDVVSMRLQEVEEGAVLVLWVRELMVELEEDYDEFDDSDIGLDDFGV